MIGLLLAALLAIPGHAQYSGSSNSSCFLGLNDSATPATLPDCESPDLLNVESNLDGTAIIKRKGYQLYASLTVATSPVTGSYTFIDGNGSRQDIVCHDHYCAHSVNGNAFSNFLSTAGGVTPPTRWSFVDVGGTLYGANDRRDPIMRYDGTTRDSPPTIPLGSILELTQDRMAVGDISGYPNRVHYSSAGAYSEFTTGVNSEDSYFDDFGAAGDRIRGIKCINGNCFIFKSASITLCEMSDQYNTQCSVISPNIGTTDPASIVAAGQSLYFRAQDKSYYEISRSGLVQISKKIPNLVKSQSGGLGGGENSNTQTSKSDWDSGTQLPSSSWNTSTINGSVFPSSASMVDTSSTDFAGGTLTSLSVNDQPGKISLSSTVFQDNFADGDFTSNPVWTITDGDWNVTSGRLTFASGSSGEIGTPQTISTGSFSFSASADANDTAQIKFMSLGTSATGSNGYALSISFDASGSALSMRLARMPGDVAVCTYGITGYYANNNAYTWTVYRNDLGVFEVNSSTGGLVCKGTDNTYNTSTHLVVRGFVHSSTSFDNFSFLHYATSGVFISRTFDTGYIPPTIGPLSSTFTVPSGQNIDGQVVFYTQTSADGSSWDAKVASSDTVHINSTAKRYVRYEADLSTKYSTQTPTISDVGLFAATTGQFTTQCIQPNTSISSWGILSCATTLAGNGSLVYYATSAATCANLPSSDPINWQTSVSNNSTPSISTNSAVKIAWRSLLTSSTDQAQVDSCVLSWTEGTPTQPAWAVYDSIKNAVYWTSTVNGASSTNRLLKYDRNLEQWYPFDIAAQAPRFINNSLYFGSSTGGYLYLFGGVDADAGSNISAYWKSKDIGADPFHEKSFKTLSIISRNQVTGSMTGTWTLSNSQTGSYTISLSTGSGITYARSNYNLPIASPQQFINVKVSNNSSTPFEVLGVGVTWQTLPWRVTNQ